MNNWFDHIQFHTRVQPETPAMVMEDRVVTYGMLEVGIDRCAQRIAKLGIVPGEMPTAVLVRNPIRHVTLCLALFKMGIPSISLEHAQFGIAGIKLAAVLGDAESKVVIGPGHRLVEITDDWFAPDPGNDSLPVGFSHNQQICRMNLTSGTTGEPKIVKFTIAESGFRTDKLIRIKWSRLLCLPGLSTSWGFWIACSALASGGTLHFSASPFQSIRMIELFSIDYVIGSTDQLLALTWAARKIGAHLRSLRIVEISGTMVTRALLESAMLHVCKDIFCRYSASEIGPIALAPGREILARPGFTGYVVPGIEIVIVDHNGRPCSPGEVGLVKCRRDTSWDRGSTGTTAEEKSWIDLGDLGWIMEAGELHIIGRNAELSTLDTTGAAPRQISPVHEIEHLLRLEWDATDAAAVMVSDGSGTSPPQIWIGIVDCKDASADKLNAILRSKGIDFVVRLFPIQGIPQAANGKVQRAELKALLLRQAQ